ETHHMIANVYEVLGELAKALPHERKARALASSNARYANALMRILIHLGNDDEALAVSHTVLNERAQFEDIFHQGDYDFGAVAAGNFFRDRSALYLRKKMYTEALQDFSRMIELSPSNLDPYKRRAECHFQLENYPLVVADLIKAVEVNPGDFSDL